MDLSPVFIGPATETFTPTQSGAIATIQYQLGRCAIQHGLNPTVIASDSNAAPFADVPVRFFKYPPVARRGLTLLLQRMERKLKGWTRLRQGRWMEAVGDILSSPELESRPWIVSNEPELAVYLRCRYKHARIICWFHNQLTCKPQSRRSLRLACNSILAVSHFTSKWTASHYDLANVETVYNAVDTDRFSPAEYEKKGLPVIQFVGRTGIEKAPDLLLRACVKLTEQTKAFRVRIVGSNYWDRFELDEYQQCIVGLVNELKQRGIEVEQTGHIGRQELPYIMRTADIHVTPSRWDEAFGLTTLEGMASGLAVIGSSTGGTPEVIGNAGLLFDRDNKEQLAAQLLSLLKDAAMLKTYQILARERALQFTWSHSWKRLHHIIQSTFGTEPVDRFNAG